MPFSTDLQEKIIEYVYGHLPSQEWYDNNLFTFIKDEELRSRLIVEHKNSRVIYKIFEGLQAKDELKLAQIKTQVIMYVSIQEAVINYVLFELYGDKEPVQRLLYQERPMRMSIPKSKLEKIKKELVHDGKDFLIYVLTKKRVDKTKIRYDQKVNACHELKLITPKMKEDLIRLYEYRNTVHLEAELKKGLDYNLEMGELAYRKVEGLNIELLESIGS